MKGLICLDIDGTITANPNVIPQPMVECLHLLYTRGWQFLFATGRTFTFAQKTLADIHFPYFFALQNGSDLLRMPEKKPIAKHYLSSSVIALIEEVTKGEEEDFLVYAGWERGDFCYYRPAKFSPYILDHINIINKYSAKSWQEVQQFCFSEEDTFPLIKYLGSKEGMHRVYEKIRHVDGIEVSYIKDPVSEGVYLNLITAPLACKGEAVRQVRSLLPKGTFCIAAGDDLNDVSMLKEADIAIAVGAAPASLLHVADIVAKPASEMGLIEALLKVTKEG
jgi:hydroxymethylpyrimidine pyrophosphatase-like HAD family hydrolase